MELNRTEGNKMKLNETECNWIGINCAGTKFEWNWI